MLAYNEARLLEKFRGSLICSSRLGPGTEQEFKAQGKPTFVSCEELMKPVRAGEKPETTMAMKSTESVDFSTSGSTATCTGHAHLLARDATLKRSPF